MTNRIGRDAPRGKRASHDTRVEGAGGWHEVSYLLAKVLAGSTSGLSSRLRLASTHAG